MKNSKLKNVFFSLILLAGGSYWGYQQLSSIPLNTDSGACVAPESVKQRAQELDLGQYCHRIAGGQYHFAYQFPDGVIYVNYDYTVVRATKF